MLLLVWSTRTSYSHRWIRHYSKSNFRSLKYAPLNSSLRRKNDPRQTLYSFKSSPYKPPDPITINNTYKQGETWYRRGCIFIIFPIQPKREYRGGLYKEPGSIYSILENLAVVWRENLISPAMWRRWVFFLNILNQQTIKYKREYKKKRFWSNRVICIYN